MNHKRNINKNLKESKYHYIKRIELSSDGYFRIFNKSGVDVYKYKSIYIHKYGVSHKLTKFDRIIINMENSNS